VHDPANHREGQKQAPVGIGIRGGLEGFFFDGLAGQVHEDHGGGTQVGVGDAARFDGEDAPAVVDGGSVAKSQVDEAVAG